MQKIINPKAMALFDSIMRLGEVVEKGSGSGVAAAASIDEMFKLDKTTSRVRGMHVVIPPPFFFIASFKVARPPPLVEF